MPIEFPCPECHKVLRTGEERAGARAICPECGETITVPQPDLAATAAWGSSLASASSSSMNAPRGVESPTRQDRVETRSSVGWCQACGTALTEASGICPVCHNAAGAVQSSGETVHAAGYAGFWRRGAAWFLDMVILSIAQGVLSFTRLDEKIWLFVVWAYFALMECSEYQATLGKMALGLVVTDEQGRRLTFLRALGRNAAKILSIIPLFLGYVMAGVSSRKQALHDLLARCLVLRKA